MTLWIPPWLIIVGKVGGIVGGWELLKFLARQWMGLGKRMGWTSW